MGGGGRFFFNEGLGSGSVRFGAEPNKEYNVMFALIVLKSGRSFWEYIPVESV